jgi:DNA transposition AAA+ family ATPase
MNHETKISIMAALEAYMAQHNMSASDVARKTGVSASYLSNMRQGNFVVSAGNGNTVELADKHFEVLAKLAGFKLEKSYWEPVPTTQLKRILATLEDARQFGYTNVVIGSTGSGKTYVTQIFAQRYPLDCFVVTVGSQDNIGDLLEKVCDQLHIASEKTKSRTLRAISRKLQDMKRDGHKPILIFDESEYMRQPALCNMKELYDNLNGTAAIILLGTSQLIRHFDRLRRKDKDGIPQLYRRIKFGIRELPAIDRTFKPFLEGVVEDRQIRSFLVEHCENYGELHDVLVPALREADRTGQPLSENLIRTMLNMPKR